MALTHIVRNRMVLVLGLSLALGLAAPAVAQEMADDMVGQDQKAWVTWSTATRALEREELAEAGKQFEAIAAMNLADLRLALMADRTG